MAGRNLQATSCIYDGWEIHFRLPGVMLMIKDTKVEDKLIDAAKQVEPELKLNKKSKDERQAMSPNCHKCHVNRSCTIYNDNTFH